MRGRTASAIALRMSRVSSDRPALTVPSLKVRATAPILASSCFCCSVRAIAPRPKRSTSKSSRLGFSSKPSKWSGRVPFPVIDQPPTCTKTPAALSSESRSTRNASASSPATVNTIRYRSSSPPGRVRASLNARFSRSRSRLPLGAASMTCCARVDVLCNESRNIAWAVLSFELAFHRSRAGPMAARAASRTRTTPSSRLNRSEIAVADVARASASVRRLSRLIPIRSVPLMSTIPLFPMGSVSPLGARSRMVSILWPHRLLAMDPARRMATSPARAAIILRSPRHPALC